jgi:hypothetical protein
MSGAGPAELNRADRRWRSAKKKILLQKYREAGQQSGYLSQKSNILSGHRKGRPDLASDLIVWGPGAGGPPGREQNSGGSGSNLSERANIGAF